MYIIEEKLKKAEAAYEKEKSGANALALFARYVLAGKTIDSEGIYLSKAYHVAVTAHQEDMLDIQAIAALLHANVILENYDSAYELIRQLEAHSTFFSKSFPLFYGQVLYFNSIVQSKTDKSRGAKKIQRNLEILYEKTELTPLLAYLGSIQKLVFGDSALCAKMYYDAMRKGLKSVFFFLDAYTLLTEEENYSSEMNELARTVLPWALNNGLAVDMIIERLEKKTLISVLFSLNKSHLSQIYALNGHPGAFQCLCQKLIFEGDTSEKALSHYLTALENHLHLRGLEQISVKAACKNNSRELPSFVVEAALRNPDCYDTEELAFLFGILALEGVGIEEGLAKSAADFGMWAFSQGLRGKDYNLIYKFLYDILPDDDRFGEVIFEELFKYEVTFKGQAVKNVCTYEYSKSGVAVYPAEEEKAYVSSVTDEFCCYFIGEAPGEYLNIREYKVAKTLILDKHEYIGLYEELYGKGYRNSELILAMALEYIRKEKLTKNDIDILQMASNLDEISKGMKLDICARLAGHYAALKQYSLAVHYYRTIGWNDIKQEDASVALKSFVATGGHSFAVMLMTSRRESLPYTEIYSAIKTLHEFTDSPEVASLCYDLILNGLCGPEVLSVLLRNYRGTSREWLVIANKIDSLGFEVSQLYEKIIVDGIFTGNAGNDCDEAFIRLYRINKTHNIIPKYVYFCCCEIIKSGKAVSDNMAEILDEIYFADDSDPILCCALAICYIRSGRQDKSALISEAALYQEEIGIILPDFKQYQDKSFISSYIEKNTPFVYCSAAHKTVFLCYKTEGAASYVRQKMKYFRFGMYIALLPMFYGEKITYYFEEEGGYKTEPETYAKVHMRLIEQFNDPFYTINNAVIYEHMMKFDMVEALIEEKLASNEHFPIITL